MKLFIPLIGLIMLANSLASPAIVAHRGASVDAPENTIAAFKLAWDKGADAVECDVWLTKDNQVVCIHDRDTKRTTGTQLDVTKSTLEQLRKLDAGKGEKIPTLTEMLSTVPSNGVAVVEIKGGWKIVALIPEIMKAANIDEGRLVIISFDAEVIKKAKQTLENSKALLLMDFQYNRLLRRWEPSDSKVIKAMKDCGADGVSVRDSKPADADLIKKVKEAGGQVHVWTVDDSDKAKHYAELGMDSITTNDPEIMK